MKRTVLSLCLVGCGVTAAHAQSNVTLYGVVDGGINYINNVAVAQTTGSAGNPVVNANRSQVKQNSGGQAGSRWGVKGSEDLGNGLEGIFQLENGFNVATGAFSSTTAEFNRQAFVGLSSASYGTLTLGRQYEAISDLLGGIGPISYGGYIATTPGDIANYDGDIHVNNSVKYRSPQIHGFTAEVLYGFGNVAGSVGQANTYNAALQYQNGPFTIGAAYLRADNSRSPTNTWNGGADGDFASSINAGFAGAQKIQIADVASQYKFGKLIVGLSYGYVNYRPSAISTFKQVQSFNTVGANAEYFVRPDYTVSLGYSYTRGSGVNVKASNASYQQVTFTNIYLLSKTVSVYADIAYEHASGKTLDVYGNVIDATASIGDAANGTSSASNSQILARAGVRVNF